jgi:hypothetical protein
MPLPTSSPRRRIFIGYRSDASRVLHVAATRAIGARLATGTDGSPLAIVRYVMHGFKESERRETTSQLFIRGSRSSKEG